LVVRVYNASAEPASARVRLDDEPARGDAVDLLGAVLAPFDGELELGPWAIATLRLLFEQVSVVPPSRGYE
jgi:hypothetical protein